MVEIRCDKCDKVIEKPIAVFKKDQYVKVRMYGGHSRSLKLDLCTECTAKLFEFLGIKDFEDLHQRIEKRITGELITKG